MEEEASAVTGGQSGEQGDRLSEWTNFKKTGAQLMARRS
jgi:hypothetical protein